MQVHQRLSILFFRKTAKKDKEGYIPIYCRVTIDGMQDEISTGCKVMHENWDNKAKLVLPADSSYKAHNKKIGQMRTDLERHFDLVVAKQGLATPQQVLASYQTPINGNQQKAENTENGKFSLDLDAVIKDYVKLSYKLEKLESLVYKPQAQVEKLNEERELLLEDLKALVKRGQKIFDDKNWSKTLILAADEFLLNFLCKLPLYLIQLGLEFANFKNVQKVIVRCTPGEGQSRAPGGASNSCNPVAILQPSALPLVR